MLELAHAVKLSIPLLAVCSNSASLARLPFLDSKAYSSETYICPVGSCNCKGSPFDHCWGTFYLILFAGQEIKELVSYKIKFEIHCSVLCKSEDETVIIGLK
jgi:hypothetical protein